MTGFTPKHPDEYLVDLPDYLEYSTFHRLDEGYLAYRVTLISVDGTRVASASARTELDAALKLKAELSRQYKSRMELVEAEINKLRKASLKEKMDGILKLRKEPVP